MLKPKGEKILIHEGLKIGLLEVGELVRNVKDHPLYIDTPSSYLSHWRLWECHCECGNVKLYSENVLSKGEIRSCGCLRQKKLQESYERKMAQLDRQTKKREISLKLSAAEKRLRFLKSAPSMYRNESLIDQVATEIRMLRAQKARANRKS